MIYRHDRMYECSQCHRLSPIASRDDIVGDMCIDCKLDEEDQLIIRDAEKIESMTCNYPGWSRE
jgi:hypothetical protein